ncbi:hypothetical protein RHSIM_Rhsim11G0154000 [Rhododendron simsii]|uniref:LOB domain-containing protein n=1 Tax=Rhododendron simsii TaxID=118357 RepID=A0A834G9G7_RHOSS|nr:hypothetical protein RHSIM_Rhsim11G0154000 [Rhododendron simsii]
MSCNGCRVLRKGCNENCVLRQSLDGIESHQAQANATVFVAKFFGRAGLMSFLSSVPESQRPALFQSLLFEACGRTVNPVNGAVGLLWTGNWHVCQSAVETVLRGGALRPIPDFSGVSPAEESDTNNNNIDFFGSQDHLRFSRRKNNSQELTTTRQDPAAADLDLRLTPGFPAKRRAETPSLNSEESETTSLESGSGYHRKSSQGERDAKVLRLFF